MFIPQLQKYKLHGITSNTWVFYNKFIRKIYVPVKHGMVQNEKLSDFYKSSAFVGTVKFKSLKWAGHVTRIDANNKIIQNFGGETCWQVDTLETWRGTKTVAGTNVNFLIW